MGGWVAFLYEYTFSRLICSSVSAPIETVLQPLHVKVLPPRPLLWDALELYASCISCGKLLSCWEGGGGLTLHWPGVFSAELTWATSNIIKLQPLWLIPQPSEVAQPYSTSRPSLRLFCVVGEEVRAETEEESGQRCHEDMDIRCVNFISVVVNTLFPVPGTKTKSKARQHKISLEEVSSSIWSSLELAKFILLPLSRTLHRPLSHSPPSSTPGGGQIMLTRTVSVNTWWQIYLSLLRFALLAYLQIARIISASQWTAAAKVKMG